MSYDSMRDTVPVSEGDCTTEPPRRDNFEAQLLLTQKALDDSLEMIEEIESVLWGDNVSVDATQINPDRITTTSSRVGYWVKTLANTTAAEQVRTRLQELVEKL